MSKPATLSRREALRQVSAMMGGVALTGSAGLMTTLVSGDAQARQALAMETEFSAADIAWLDEMAETLLPETATPGARAAAVGAFLALMVTDTYNDGEQAEFREGMRTMERYAEENFGAGLTALDSGDRIAVLEHFDREQSAWQDNKDDDDLPHFFRMMKELSLLGLFTSEAGCKQILRYIETPGRFDPCYPLEPGDTSWAPR